MLGEFFPDHLKDGFLSSMVGFCYQVVDSLFSMHFKISLKKIFQLFSSCIRGSYQGLFKHAERYRDDPNPPPSKVVRPGRLKGNKTY